MLVELMRMTEVSNSRRHTRKFYIETIIVQPIFLLDMYVCIAKNEKGIINYEQSS